MKRINEAERLDTALRSAQEAPPELLGMVNAARQLEKLSPTSPLSATVKNQARQIFLSQALELRSQSTSALKSEDNHNWFSRIKKLLSLSNQPVFAPIMALVAILVLFSLGLGVNKLHSAVQSSLPGDRLYAYKLVREDLRENFTVDTYQQVLLNLELAQVRNQEISKLAQEGRSVPLETISAFEYNLSEALIKASQLSDIELQSGLAQIQAVSSSAGDHLAMASTWVPDDSSKTSINLAAMTAFNASNLASLGMNDPQQFRNFMSGPTSQKQPTPTTTARITFPQISATPVVMMPTATLGVMLPPATWPTNLPTQIPTQIPAQPSPTSTQVSPIDPTSTNPPPTMPTPTPIVGPTQVVPSPTQLAPSPTSTAQTPDGPPVLPTPTLIHNQGGEN